MVVCHEVFDHPFSAIAAILHQMRVGPLSRRYYCEPRQELGLGVCDPTQSLGVLAQVAKEVVVVGLLVALLLALLQSLLSVTCFTHFCSVAAARLASCAGRGFPRGGVHRLTESAPIACGAAAQERAGQDPRGG